MSDAGEGELFEDWFEDWVEYEGVLLWNSALGGNETGRLELDAFSA